MADTADETDEKLAALRSRRDELSSGDGGGALGDALDRKIEQSERELDEYRELTELKLTLAEAEEAGLGDDPAIKRLRERIADMEDALGLAAPEDDGEQQVAALKSARDGAEWQGNDELVDSYDEKIATAESEQAIAEDDDVKIASLSEADGPSERAQAKVKYAYDNKFDDEARDELDDLSFRLNLGRLITESDDMIDVDPTPTQEKIAALCADHGVNVVELEE